MCGCATIDTLTRVFILHILILKIFIKYANNFLRYQAGCNLYHLPHLNQPKKYQTRSYKYLMSSCISTS